MSLDSFSKFNATACPGAFCEPTDGLAIIVRREDDNCDPSINGPDVLPLRSPLPLPFPLSPDPADNAQAQDDLVKTFTSCSPQHAFCLPEDPQNDILRYLDLAPCESDTETFSKISAESLSSHEAITPQTPPPLLAHSYGNAAIKSEYEGRLSPIPDVCTSLIANPNDTGRGMKRKQTPTGNSAKRRKTSQTSKFCHICVRSGEQIRLAPCANVISGVCRKAVCERCFAKHGMINEWENACRNNGVISGIRTTGGVEVPDDAWTCVHCRSVCPPNAQCKIYSRTNKKRNLTLRRKKMERKSTIDVLPGVRMMGESEQDFLLEGMEEVLGFEIPLK